MKRGTHWSNEKIKGVVKIRKETWKEYEGYKQYRPIINTSKLER